MGLLKDAHGFRIRFTYYVDKNMYQEILYSEYFKGVPYTKKSKQETHAYFLQQREKEEIRIIKNALKLQRYVY